LHTETRGITGQHNWNEWAAVAGEGMERRTCRTDPAHEQTGVTGIGRFLFEAIGHPAASYRVRKGTATAGEVQLPACYRPNTASEYLPVTEIGNDAFSGCTGLASVTFAAGSQLASIGGNAFSGCTSLASIEIPAGVTSIGQEAFRNCTSLASVTFAAGSQLESIGQNALFSGCTSLASITVDAANTVYASEDGILYNKAETLIIIVPGGISGNVTIPAGVTTIGNGAFRNCSSLASIEIPAGVTSLPDDFYGSGVFSGCTSLASVTFGAGSQLASIGGNAFYGCNSLASIDIPAGVTSIGSDAFWQCSSLASVTFAAGSQLASIGYWTFYNCSSLAGIAIPAGVTAIGNDAFEGSSLASITADDANTNYASQDGILYNKAKTQFILIPREIIGAVTIPAGVTSIGSSAFYGRTNLASVTFAAGSQLESIGNRAFSWCSSLTSITTPAI
jgi:hypothetical protein